MLSQNLKKDEDDMVRCLLDKNDIFIWLLIISKYAKSYQIIFQTKHKYAVTNDIFFQTYKNKFKIYSPLIRSSSQTIELIET